MALRWHADMVPQQNKGPFITVSDQHPSLDESLERITATRGSGKQPSRANKMTRLLLTRQRELTRWMRSLLRSRLRADTSGPRILSNSIPKSGTHLLTRCLWLLPGVEDSDLRIRGRIKPETLGKRLNQVGGGCFIPLHLAFTPERKQLLTDLGFTMVLIARDPRDIAVSHFHYVSRQARMHRLRAYYNSLPDDSARLMTSIRGIPESKWQGHMRLGDISRRCLVYLDWADHGACVVQFEKLIGPLGGGTRQAQHGEIRKIAAHLDMALDSSTVEYVAANVYYHKSSTFRKGIVGDWMNHMTPEHKAAFKEVAGQLLIDLGYETDEDW